MTELEVQRGEKWDIPDGEFCVYGTVYAHPEHADKVEAVYKETTRLIQFEPGVVYYCLSRDRKDPTIFHFFERYKSREIFDKHNNQEIIKRFIEAGWMKDVSAVFAKAIEPFPDEKGFKDAGTGL